MTRFVLLLPSLPASNAKIPTLLLLLSALSLPLSGCSSDSNSPKEDVSPQPDAAQDDSLEQDAVEETIQPGCTLEGTYTIVDVQLLSGACTIDVADDTMAIRHVELGYMLDFDSTDWEGPAATLSTCTLHSDGPTTWLWNGALRTRTLHITVSGDTLVAELTDKLDEPSSTGETCDASWKITANRSGPAPTGAAVGEDGCGPLGCSASRCAFGQEFGCESGICLFDTTAGWSSFCTKPCTQDTDCPEGFVCLEAYEGWDGAPEGFYCAKWRAVCGNKVTEEGELCDDGNTKDGDGCSADCKSNESCGNGILENDEFCEPTLFQEWLPCNECQFQPPAGVMTPLPIESESVVATSVGPNTFVLASAPTFDADYEGIVRFARTTDGGATWTTPPPAAGAAYMRPITITSAGNKVALGLTNGTADFYLTESTNGGSSWSAATLQTISGGAVTTDMTMERLELALLDDGTLLAAIGKDDGLILARRSAETSTFSNVASLDMCSPHGWSNGQLAWDPYRFDLYSGAGVQISVQGNNVTLLAAGTCYDGTFNHHVAYALRSDDGGATFAPAQDLMLASGLTQTRASAISPTPRGPAAICLAGLNDQQAGAVRCALQPDSQTDPWTFFDTPLPQPDPNYSPAAEAILAAGPQELMLVQNAIDMAGGNFYRTTDLGQTWTTLNTGETVSWNRTLRSVGPDAAWLIEVDGNNELSLVRINLADNVVEPRFYLFGDARRGDGSGMPWRVAWASDGQGNGILGFSIPDAIRYWITVVRSMK